jgi:hypothetical protein
VAKRLSRRTMLGVSFGLSLATAAKALRVPSVQAAELPPETAADAIRRAVAHYAVDRSNFARRVLYTWTTFEQIEELRADPLLLTRRESPVFGPSGFDKRVAEGRGPMAELLQRPQLSARRFGWPAAWGTALGFRGESYGNQLIRVTLKAEAIIAAFTPARAKPWTFAAVSGAEMPFETLRDNPERLAAVYYEASDQSGQLAYREYVLCNESTIKTWDHATPEIAAELSHEEAVLRGLIDWIWRRRGFARNACSRTERPHGKAGRATCGRSGDRLRRDRRALETSARRGTCYARMLNIIL